MSIRISSTPVDKLQETRDRREKKRAYWAAINTTDRLKRQGKESSTTHGRVLFQANAERVTVALGLLLEELLSDPHRGGRHLACWPLLLLVNRGPRSLALVALSVVIDTISRAQPDKVIARCIGDAIQDEVRALRVEDNRGQAMLRLVRRRLGARRLADPKVLQALQLDASGWDLAQRREVGMLLLELIEANTDLIQFSTVRSRRVSRRMVLPTPAALEVIKANPPRPIPMRQLPLLVRPLDWQGMQGGGHQGSTAPLVRSRAGNDLGYLDAEALAPVLKVVNRLQGQQLLIDPWMVETQRQAWDANIPGLFGVTREPRPEPPRPVELVGDVAWALYHRECREIRRELHDGAAERQRVEETLRQQEQVAGLPVWFAYCVDFRGRVFSSNRYATHQGPDWEKAALQFGHGELVSVDGFEWLLKAAAGHWGVRSSWADRLRWGQEHLPELVAAAEAPLDRLDLWRGAKDPWQYLQACRAIAQQIENPNTPCGTPVRFDQTCSGLGITAALTRDRAIGRLTNLWGSTRRDIYGHVAEKLIDLLRLDLSNGNSKEQRLAEFWLQFGVDRSLMKGPVMTTIYGATHLGVIEQLIASLVDRDADINLAQWQKGYITPAGYLARKLSVLLGAELASCIALRTWLSNTCRLVLRHERPLRWTGPSGFPVQLAQQYDGRRGVTSLTRGRRRWRAITDADGPAGLSAQQTVRAISANVIHSFDAAFCHGVISTCEDHCVPVLTNHDCFATTPRNAEWLHRELHHLMGTTYRADWLAEITAEIRAANGDLKVISPPVVGSLCPGEIGQNPNCFS